MGFCEARRHNDEEEEEKEEEEEEEEKEKEKEEEKEEEKKKYWQSAKGLKPATLTQRACGRRPPTEHVALSLEHLSQEEEEEEEEDEQKKGRRRRRRRRRMRPMGAKVFGKARRHDDEFEIRTQGSDVR